MNNLAYWILLIVMVIITILAALIKKNNATKVEYFVEKTQKISV